MRHLSMSKEDQNERICSSWVGRIVDQHVWLYIDTFYTLFDCLEKLEIRFLLHYLLQHSDCMALF